MIELTREWLAIDGLKWDSVDLAIYTTINQMVTARALQGIPNKLDAKTKTVKNGI